MTGEEAGRRRGREAADPDTVGSGSGVPADPESAAQELCLRLLTARPRSRSELADALHRKGVSADVADRVLTRLGEVGLVDDEAYAAMVVQSGQRNRSLGRRALSAQLRRKGIAERTANEAVVAADSEDEENAARRLVKRKLRTMSGLDDTTRIGRLMGMLARRGYSEALAYRVVREVLREHGMPVELPDPEHVT
ncbi:MAG: regulatory protein RecX [Pseudonocardia sp.]|nr:regulatory protein RecX [Pseudonocardia sp.]